MRRDYDNAFKIQWELFLRHVALDEPFRWTLREGAKGVQLAELGIAELEGAQVGGRAGTLNFKRNATAKARRPRRQTRRRGRGKGSGFGDSTRRL